MGPPATLGTGQPKFRPPWPLCPRIRTPLFCRGCLKLSVSSSFHGIIFLLFSLVFGGPCDSLCRCQAAIEIVEWTTELDEVTTKLRNPRGHRSCFPLFLSSILFAYMHKLISVRRRGYSLSYSRAVSVVYGSIPAIDVC